MTLTAYLDDDDGDDGSDDDVFDGDDDRFDDDDDNDDKNENDCFGFIMKTARLKKIAYKEDRRRLSTVQHPTGRSIKQF